MTTLPSSPRTRYAAAAAQARRMLHARGGAARIPFGDWARDHLLARGFSPREADAAIRAAFAAATDRLKADPVCGGAFAGTPAGARGQRPFLANCVRYIRGGALPPPVGRTITAHLTAHPELVWRLAALGYAGDAR